MSCLECHLFSFEKIPLLAFISKHVDLSREPAGRQTTEATCEPLHGHRRPQHLWTRHSSTLHRSGSLTLVELDLIACAMQTLEIALELQSIEWTCIT